jgi:hypothetical protein
MPAARKSREETRAKYSTNRNQAETSTHPKSAMNFHRASGSAVVSVRIFCQVMPHATRLGSPRWRAAMPTDQSDREIR